MTSPPSPRHSSAWRRFGAAAVTAMIFLLARTEPAEAQKKISLLTWNIPVYKDKIDGWIADFKQLHPDVQVEWLDKKGTEWATFYQTQVVGGAAPDIIDVQGALWLEYAANGGLVDLTPYLAREPQLRDWYNPKFLATWVYEGKQYLVPFYVSKTLLFMNRTLMQEAGLTRPPPAPVGTCANRRGTCRQGRRAAHCCTPRRGPARCTGASARLVCSPAAARLY